MALKPKLAIIGDSWGCGAWSTASGLLVDSDDYLTAAFSQHYRVYNFSNGGASNQQILNELIQCCKSNPDILNTYKFLIIQTDPLRDLLRFDYDWDYGNELVAQYNLKDLLQFRIYHYYFQLNNVCRKHNIKVNLIGGFSDVMPSVEKFENINVVCKSWSKLIDPMHVPTLYAASCDLTKILENFSSDNSTIIEEVILKNQTFSRNEGNSFGWHGDNHPSRKGIDILVNTIYNKLL